MCGISAHRCRETGRLGRLLVGSSLLNRRPQDRGRPLDLVGVGLASAQSWSGPPKKLGLATKL